jgi:hypothetical protein
LGKRRYSLHCSKLEQLLLLAHDAAPWAEYQEYPAVARDYIWNEYFECILLVCLIVVVFIDNL